MLGSLVGCNGSVSHCGDLDRGDKRQRTVVRHLAQNRKIGRVCAILIACVRTQSLNIAFCLDSRASHPIELFLCTPDARVAQYRAFDTEFDLHKSRTGQVIEREP